MLRIGQSKYVDQIRGTAISGIYSWGTYRTYLKEACYYVKWCRDNYGCRTLEECKPYARDWIESRSDLSAYTIKLDMSAINKLYGERVDIAQGIETSQRRRVDITRSRGNVIRDSHFSEDRHKDIVTWCRCTGLRRAELSAITGKDISIVGDKMYVYVHVDTKGGRERIAPIMPVSQEERDIIARIVHDHRDGSRLWDYVPNGMDVHSYRAEYATRVYLDRAMPLDKLDRSDKYYCRGDRRGVVYDRSAMLDASMALGHSRVSVIAQHYLQV